MRCIRSVLLTCFFLAAHAVGAQTPTVERLKTALGAASDPADRLSAALRICEERDALSADTLMRYASVARRLAHVIGRAEKILEADYYTGVALQSRGDVDSAIRLATARLEQLGEGAYDLRQKFTYLLANSYVRTNRYREAISTAYTVLHRAEAEGDTLMQMTAKNTIGWACMEMGSDREAIGWFRRSISMHSIPTHGRTAGGARTARDKVYGIACSNMAAVYNGLQQFDSGEYFISESIRAARRTDNLRGLANALAIQGDGFILTGRQARAEAPLREALAIRRTIGDPFYIVSDMAQLAFYYSRSGNAARGIALCEEAIHTARHHRLTAKLPVLYEVLAECYKAAGDDKGHNRALQALLAVKDSVYQMNTAQALGDLQAKYQVAKAENVIMSQRLALIRQNALLAGAAGLVVVIGGSSVVLLRRYRRRQRLELARIQEEDRQAAVLAVREAEEAERKRIAADLHDNLGAYAAAIASNIDHLEPSVLSAGNPANTSAHSAGPVPTSVMQQLRANSRDMVSQLSDTIWVLKKDALPLTAISDRLKIFVQRIAASHPGIGLDVVERLEEDPVLSPLQAFHLFRIVQEAVTNAVRHSGGSSVAVLLESTADNYRVCITDDGQGMSSASAHQGEGSGLHSMAARAEAGGWRIAWNTVKPRGTEVCIAPQVAAPQVAAPQTADPLQAATPN